MGPLCVLLQACLQPPPRLKLTTSTVNANPTRKQKWRVLAIDDNPSIHEDFRKVLLNDPSENSLAESEALLFGEVASNTKNCPNFNYVIDSAFQGKDGFELVREAIESGKPYSAALIDVRMPPGWDGVETARRIWEIAPELPIVLCTAYSDYGWEEIVNQLPKMDQLLILKKPFEPFELRQIVAAQVSRWHLNRRAMQTQMLSEAIIERRTRQIESVQDLVFTSLAKLAESRDPETGEHLERIEFYTRVLAERLAESGPYRSIVSQSYIDYVSRSSILHDIGKVGIPDEVLLKPGRLSPQEFEVMKTHAAIGADALDDAAGRSQFSHFLRTAAEIARYHHERYDGSGYPEHLSAESIPLSARIVAVADVFDALTSERVYKSAMDPDKAREIIESERGKHFDPVIVDAFLDCWELISARARENQSHSRKAINTIQLTSG